jgi:hypothetical protein
MQTKLLASLNKIIMGDEIWYFAYDPETKRQSSETPNRLQNYTPIRTSNVNCTKRKQPSGLTSLARTKQLTPNYINIKINGNTPQVVRTLIDTAFSIF